MNRLALPFLVLQHFSSSCLSGEVYGGEKTDPPTRVRG